MNGPAATLSREASATTSFIAIAPRRLPDPRQARTYYLGRFEAARFSPELFSTLGVSAPPVLARSVVKRQAEFLAGRLCARAALAPLGQAQHVVATGAHREPLWPAGMCGSLTHAGALAAAIVLPAGQVAGIGIDIETIIGDATRPALSGSVVSARELACLRASGAPFELNTLLTLVFSAKEAFFKAAFGMVRRYFDFDALELSAFDPVAHRLRFRCTQMLCPQLPAGLAVDAYFEELGHSSVFTTVTLPAPT
jgi:4'-phosphopantetheinyl transferase EntD